MTVGLWVTFKFFSPSLNNYFQAEFDSPKTLLQKTDWLLKSLLDGSGDKNALYAIADGNGSNFSWDVVIAIQSMDIMTWGRVRSLIFFRWCKEYTYYQLINHLQSVVICIIAAAAVSLST